MSAAAAAAIAERAPGFTPAPGADARLRPGRAGRAARRPRRDPLRRDPRLPRGRPGRPQGHAQPGRARGQARRHLRRPLARLRGPRPRRHHDAGADAARRWARRRSCSPTRPARCAPRRARAASSASATTSTCSASTRWSGPNDDSAGPRFPSLRDAYDPELRERLHAAADGLGTPLHDGVYLAVAGPELRDAGGDPRVPDAGRRPRRHEHGPRGDRRAPLRPALRRRSPP